MVGRMELEEIVVLASHENMTPHLEKFARGGARALKAELGSYLGVSIFEHDTGDGCIYLHRWAPQ